MISLYGITFVTGLYTHTKWETEEIEQTISGPMLIRIQHVGASSRAHLCKFGCRLHGFDGVCGAPKYYDFGLNYLFDWFGVQSCKF